MSFTCLASIFNLEKYVFVLEHLLSLSAVQSQRRLSRDGVSPICFQLTRGRPDEWRPESRGRRRRTDLFDRWMYHPHRFLISRHHYHTRHHHHHHQQQQQQWYGRWSESSLDGVIPIVRYSSKLRRGNQITRRRCLGCAHSWRPPSATLTTPHVLRLITRHFPSRQRRPGWRIPDWKRIARHIGALLVIARYSDTGA